MKPQPKQPKPTPKIIHILADGRRMESLKGYVVQYTPETEQLYRMLARV